MAIQKDKLSEETRIRKENKKIDDYSKHLFYALNYYYKNNYRKITENMYELSLESKLLSNDKDIGEPEYIVSRIFLALGEKATGRKDNIDQEMVRDSDELIHHILSGEFYISPLSRYYRNIINGPLIFYRDDKNSFRSIDIMKDYGKHLPPVFYLRPSSFIENCKNVDRDYTEMVDKVKHLILRPYDGTKVKEYKNMVFKRVDLSKVDSGEYEIKQAQKLEKLLESVGNERFKIQKFLGSVYDKGNVYLLSEKMPNSINLYDWWIKTRDPPFPKSRVNFPPELKAYFELKSHLKESHYDLEPRNTILSYFDSENFSLTLIDFEKGKKDSLDK